MNGKAPLAYETALELERVLSVPASFWNAAEAQYRDVLARQRLQAVYETQAEWAASFPLKEMAEHGFIAQDAGPEAVLGFFGVSSVDAYNTYWSSPRRLAARMSTAYTARTPAITAWIRAGEVAAESVRTAPYSEGRFRAVLQRLRASSREPAATWRPAITTQCAEAGVAVVFVPDLKGTRCHAACWWASRTRAVIQLGSRYASADQVWFSLYHEAGHLLLDDRRSSTICELDADPAAEKRANDFAADTLIPPEACASLHSGARPTRARVIEFAEQMGIAPGIVVGRLQRDGVIPYSSLNDLKERLARE